MGFLREEKIRLKGRLSEAKTRLKELEIKADGLIISLRLHIDPYKKLVELQGELIAQQAQELAQIYEEAKKLKAEIDRMEADLG